MRGEAFVAPPAQVILSALKGRSKGLRGAVEAYRGRNAALEKDRLCV